MSREERLHEQQYGIASPEDRKRNGIVTLSLLEDCVVCVAMARL